MTTLVDRPRRERLACAPGAGWRPVADRRCRSPWCWPSPTGSGYVAARRRRRHRAHPEPVHQLVARVDPDAAGVRPRGAGRAHARHALVRPRAAHRPRAVLVVRGCWWWRPAPWPALAELGRQLGVRLPPAVQQAAVMGTMQQHLHRTAAWRTAGRRSFCASRCVPCAGQLICWSPTSCWSAGWSRCWGGRLTVSAASGAGPRAAGSRGRRTCACCWSPGWSAARSSTRRWCPSTGPSGRRPASFFVLLTAAEVAVAGCC